MENVANHFNLQAYIFVLIYPILYILLLYLTRYIIINYVNALICRRRKTPVMVSVILVTIRI